MDSNEKTRLRDSVQRKPCPVTTKLEKRLIIILSIVVVVGIGLSIAVVSYSKGKSRNLELVNDASNLCLTSQCISTAANLLHSMDLTQDPCEDFYTFTCGNWIKNSYLVGEITSQFTRLNTLITLRVKELLSSPNLKLSEHEKKVRGFYNACMDIDSRDAAGLKFLVKDLKDFGGWPLLNENWEPSDFNWTDLLVKFYEAGYPNGMLLNIEVDVDIKNTSESLILVNQPSLGLGDRGYYILKKDKAIRRYKQLIVELALHLDPAKDWKEVVSAVNGALEIEKRLAKVMVGKINAKHPDDYYNIQTLSEIEKLTPKIPWRYLLSNLLPSTTVLHDDERIMIAVPPALEILHEILEEVDSEGGTSKKDLANYMFYRAVLFAAEHLNQDLYSMYQDKLPHSKRVDLWQTCVSEAMEIFHMSLTASYAERYLDTESKSLLEMMFQDIQVSLMDSIKEADWLDKETKQKALLKVRKVRSAIAYREEMLNEETMNEYYSPIKIGDDHFTNVKSVYNFKTRERMEGLHTKRIRFRWSDTSNLLRANAFYLPSQNSIIIPIGLIHETIFSSGRPNYINYGSLGTILGHEYTHAFDSAGSLYDDEGNYEMWWTNQSWANFKEKSECYVNQYDKYYESLVESFVNGSITLSENIADNGGVISAYSAYQKLLSRTGKEKRLPGLPYSERQMFWIAYASVWCRKQSDYNLLYTIENSAHAPSKFRIIGALSNTKEFSEDFNCKVGSNLNPEARCTLWK